MKRLIMTLALSLAGAPVGAQWLNQPTPGMPRTADGKPNLSAPAPRAQDGTPDLSGTWRFNGFGYSFNIFGSEQVDMRPWAKSVYAGRVASYGQGSPHTNCLPAGPRAGLFGQDPVKFVQTPGLLLVRRTKPRRCARSFSTAERCQRIRTPRGWAIRSATGRATRWSSTAQVSTTGHGST